MPELINSQFENGSEQGHNKYLITWVNSYSIGGTCSTVGGQEAEPDTLSQPVDAGEVGELCYVYGLTMFEQCR